MGSGLASSFLLLPAEIASSPCWILRRRNRVLVGRNRYCTSPDVVVYFLSIAALPGIQACYCIKILSWIDHECHEVTKIAIPQAFVLSGAHVYKKLNTIKAKTPCWIIWVVRNLIRPFFGVVNVNPFQSVPCDGISFGSCKLSCVAKKYNQRA